MDELKRAQIEFTASLMAFDRAASAAPRMERVLPADLDLDEELGALFAVLDR